MKWHNEPIQPDLVSFMYRDFCGWYPGREFLTANLKYVLLSAPLPSFCL